MEDWVGGWRRSNINTMCNHQQKWQIGNSLKKIKPRKEGRKKGTLWKPRKKARSEFCVSLGDTLVTESACLAHTQ